MKRFVVHATCMTVVGLLLVVPAAAQATRPQPQATRSTPAPQGSSLPADYVIGVEDLLSIVFWRDKELSGDVVVRPDGKISLPLLNDVHAAGLTPEQLAAALKQAASKYITDADVAVIVKEIRSRKVFVIGEVARGGVFALTADMNVLQAIAAVGGLLEYANRDNIVIVRNENGRERRYKFNYNEVLAGKNVEQNILLQPGDVIVVR